VWEEKKQGEEEEIKRRAKQKWNNAGNDRTGRLRKREKRLRKETSGRLKRTAEGSATNIRVCWAEKRKREKKEKRNDESGGKGVSKSGGGGHANSEPENLGLRKELRVEKKRVRKAAKKSEKDFRIGSQKRQNRTLGIPAINCDLHGRKEGTGSGKTYAFRVRGILGPGEGPKKCSPNPGSNEDGL